MAKPNSDKAAQDSIEGRTAGRGGDSPEPEATPPAAGPHANPELINPDATPGTGALPTPGKEGDADPGSG